MILDTLAEFCDATSVAAAAGTAIVGNVMDLGALPANVFNGSTAGLHNLSGGETIYLVLEISTQIITAGAAGTVYFSLVSAPTATITTNGITHATSVSVVTDDAAAINALIDTDITNAAPDLTHVTNQTPLAATSSSWHSRLAAYLPVLIMPLPSHRYRRYLGITATTVTTTTTAGAINAYLTKNPALWNANATFFTDKGSP